MPLACNIDGHGRVARLIYGIVMIAVGVGVAIFWGYARSSILAWAIAVICILAGTFGVYEARKGWCVMRAMGFKTLL